MTKRGKLILIVIVMFCLGILVASFFWHSDTLYSGAYAPMVQKSLERQEAERVRKKETGETSDEPQAPGFKEKDIDRQKGSGFSTY
jgi:uncharacterized protein YxeA